jgi:hypothetical protein
MEQRQRRKAWRMEMKMRPSASGKTVEYSPGQRMRREKSFVGRG